MTLAIDWAVKLQHKQTKQALLKAQPIYSSPQDTEHRSVDLGFCANIFAVSCLTQSGTI